MYYNAALLIFSLQKLQVFTVSQIPLQFHCIFYRQPTVNIFLQFLHSIFALFVCKKCSETAVGFVTTCTSTANISSVAECLTAGKLARESKIFHQCQVVALFKLISIKVLTSSWPLVKVIFWRVRKEYC